MDAVESLAGEAGLEVPKKSARDAEAEQERLDLFGVMDAAQAEFVRLLRERQGGEALSYLRRRGLSDATIARFGLGWSGEGRGSLTKALGRAGIEATRMEEAGLLRPADENGPTRELYWNRVTFPIRDRRGRIISFGGRALGDAKPKYINGPDTTLYQKRGTLYALDLAREGVRRGPLVVVEGYMDVIALHQAGFEAAVAPLGTALTADQLEALWRLSPAPVLCFDGDAAGGRAAARAAELCLPMVTPDRSLAFVTLPSGQDPDSLIREGGAGAFQALLDAKQPLDQALFALLRQGTGDGPEARASFRARLDAAAARIADRALSQEFRNALRDRFYAARRRPGAGKKPPPRLPRSLPAPDAAFQERARCLTAILLRHPGLLRDTEEAYAGLDLPSPLARLREAILNAGQHAALDSTELLSHLQALGLTEETAFVLSTAMPLPPSARPDAMPAEAEAEWWHLFGLISGLSRLDDEVADAALAFRTDPTEATQRRLIGLQTARLDLIGLDADL